MLVARLPKHDIHRLASRQLSDYDAGTPGTLFAGETRLSIGEAYQLQIEVSQLRRQRGERLVGYKVGCTSTVIQRQLGIDRPVFGALFHTERHVTASRVSSSKYDHLAIEGELADNVVRSLRWLADELPRHGLRLRPAQIVLTGSLMGLIPIAPDSRVLVDAGRLGTAEIEVCR